MEKIGSPSLEMGFSPLLRVHDDRRIHMWMFVHVHWCSKDIMRIQ